MKEQIKIACLPVAGSKNPYQNLMIKGLNNSETIKAFNGTDDRFFGIVKTYFKFKPNYIHFDWIQSYYIRKYFWLTILMLPFFMCQILFIRYLTKTKLVWTLHNIFPHDSGRKKFHKLVRSFFAKKCLFIRVFSNSTVVRASLELSISKSKFVVVPEGDYISVYPNDTNFFDSRKKLNIPESEVVFLSLGFLKPYKGIEKLIDTFIESELDAKLVIAGEGINEEYVKLLKKKSSKSKSITIIDKFISNDQLQYYYNSSNIVILPFTKVENSGSTIMAMGFKRVIIAPNIGVISDRLSSQREFLYEKDISEILNKDLVLNCKELESIGERNFINLKSFEWSDFASVFLQVIKEA